MANKKNYKRDNLTKSQIVRPQIEKRDLEEVVELPVHPQKYKYRLVCKDLAKKRYYIQRIDGTGNIIALYGDYDFASGQIIELDY